jgi:hypothetical protein
VLLAKVELGGAMGDDGSEGKRKRRKRRHARAVSNQFTH